MSGFGVKEVCGCLCRQPWTFFFVLLLVIHIEHGNKTWTENLAIRNWLHLIISSIQTQDLLLAR